jgi:hypothetical protein
LVAARQLGSELEAMLVYDAALAAAAATTGIKVEAPGA